MPKYLFRSSHTVEGLKGLLKEGGSGRREAVEENVGKMFQGGSAVMTTRACGFITTLAKAGKFKFGATIIPAHPVHGRGDMNGANHMGVGARSKNPQEAWNLVKFWCSHEAGVRKVLMGSGTPGARADVYYDGRLAAMHPGYANVAKADEFAKRHTVPWNLRGRECIDALHNNMDLVWLQKVGVEEGVAKTTEEVQKIMDKPRP